MDQLLLQSRDGSGRDGNGVLTKIEISWRLRKIHTRMRSFILKCIIYL